MAEIVMIHASKQGRRPHHIEDWANLRGLRQADIVDRLGVNKGTVSRWFSGATPTEPHQEALAELFGCEDREALFRHPDDDWLTRFFAKRSAEERARAIAVLEAAFPLTKAGD